MDDQLRSKISDDLAKGDISEDLFMKLAIAEGYTCEKSSRYENMHEHWDVMIAKDGVYESIDVKGIKHDTADGKTWVELKNVHGDIGWLYVSELKAIAFERDNRFDLVMRTDLVTLVEENVRKSDIDDEGFTIYYEKAGLGNYRRYCRKNWGRNDITVKVPFADIDKLIYKTFYK